MTAIVLLHTNPGFQEKGRSVLKSIATKNVKVNSVLHVFGRFDVVIFCECTNVVALREFDETLRKDGVFDTETLIAIE